MFDQDTNADGTVSRRSVLKLTGGLVAGSTALAGLGSERGAAATDDERLRADLRERNEEYIAVRVRMPEELYERVNERGAFPERVFLGDADQFVVHDDEDAVSLPEDTEGLATPVEMEDLGTDGEIHGKLLYFRTGDVDWPREYDGVEVTLGIGAFPERTIPGTEWDGTPGLWIDVREITEDYITVRARLPDSMEVDDVDSADEVLLGHADQFVIHEEEDAVSLPEETDGLANPIEMDFENPHEVTLYFRTEDVDLSETEDGEVRLGLGAFTERTIPGPAWDADTGVRG